MDEAESIEVLHVCPGRMRLRIAGLRGRPDLARSLRSIVSAEVELHGVEPRATTGSLVIRFDRELGNVAVLGAVRRAWLATNTVTTFSGASELIASGARASGAPYPSDALKALSVDGSKGLPIGEAAARLTGLHPNVLPQEAGISSAKLLARQFEGLPVLMLVGSSVVSLATGGVVDAVATLAVVLLNGALGFATEGQAERTIHTLMDTSSRLVPVLRDGSEMPVPADALVPGDILQVGPGMQVPADARLIEARGLRVDEATLTGENEPVEKAADAIVASKAPIGDRRHMLFAGTIVAEGRGWALVTATGGETEAARIQRLAMQGGRPQAPVEAELDRLGAQLAIASLAACGVFALVGWARGYRLAVILKDALALAVAAVPEALPMVATSTLSIGLRKLERHGILIRQLSAVESLGALQIACLDKTGTLTENSMQVIDVQTAGAPKGPADPRDLERLVRVAALNNDANEVAGSPTEVALLELARLTNLDVEMLRAARPRRKTLERAPGRPWMATRHGGRGLAWTLKGSPEAVLERCSHVRSGGRRRPLDRAKRSAILEQNDRLAARPARVLALAEGSSVGESGPEGFTLLGLVALSDPIRPSAPAFLRRLQRAGIRPVLITGDQAATATATARELDLGQGEPLRIVDTRSVGSLEPELLAGLAKETHVFARVASHEKQAIVKALQEAGHVVAMTGDGVNDGPALSAADVGIAMGKSGADLARDVANVVIRDDRLETLAEAIAEGRAIYRNIRRALEFLITTNMSEIAVSIAEAAHGPGELETPMELLWINMVTDVLPGLGLALAEPDPDVMERPPRAVSETIIPRRDAVRMAQDGALISAAALAAHFFALARHGPGPATRGVTFLALSQGQLLYTLVCQRSDPRHLSAGRLLENRTLDAALLVSIGLGLLPFAVPPLRRLLGIDPLDRLDTAVALGAATVPFATVLARRGLRLALHPGEIERCATSS